MGYSAGIWSLFTLKIGQLPCSKSCAAEWTFVPQLLQRSAQNMPLGFYTQTKKKLSLPFKNNPYVLSQKETLLKAKSRDSLLIEPQEKMPSPTEGELLSDLSFPYCFPTNLTFKVVVVIIAPSAFDCILCTLWGKGVFVAGKPWEGNGQMPPFSNHMVLIQIDAWWACKV